MDAAVRRLIEAAKPQRLYLFGSYVRNQATRDSDLDVLVVVDDSVADTRQESVRLRALLQDIRMPMDVLVVRAGTFERLKDRIGLIYREVVRHGRLVYDRRIAA